MIPFFRKFERTAPAVAVAGLVLALGAALVSGVPTVSAREEAVKIPPPAVDGKAGGGLETVILAGGCFWGVQGVFQHVEGVEGAVSGYAGGSKDDPTYYEVSSGTTGHAEAVEIRFDPAKISYGRLLQIFFSVAHNPTQLDYQGPDHGTQYRSAIFPTSDEQKKVAEAYVAQLDRTGLFRQPIVTRIEPAAKFYPAEDYHQDYATIHPSQPYIVYNDLPKIANLKATFPEVWREEPKLVFAANAPRS